MDELIRKQDALDVTMETVFVEYEDGDPRKEESIILQTKTAIRDGIKALPTVQPTQPNCEYCHTDRDGYVFPLEKNSHAFIDRDKIVLKANGWRGEAKIKYCPICGRRLTDG
jgi:hypothetical protein